MNAFGIQLTAGHLIVAAVLVVAYDAFWTWVMSNKAAAWWFERLQGLLKLGIYTGFVAFVILFVYMPWPLNIVLLVTTVIAIVSIVIWLNRRNTQKENPDVH